MIRGSEWRKCDLHIHTASSYDYKYKGHDSDELLVKAWRENNISLVAITDHFLIDEKRILKLKRLAPEITILPGVELRCDKGSTNLHMILIFPEDNVTELAKQFDVIMISNSAKAKENHETIYWDYNDILEFADNNNGIISIHAGKKTSGVDQEITNSLPINMAVKTEIASDIHIFEMGKIQDLKGYEEHVFTSIERKPMIICSDNHDCREYKLKENLWIKGDPTFEGLLQAIKEPELRFFVGEKPLKNKVIEKNPDKFLDSIQIYGVGPDDRWFEDNIPLNADLVTVIGNKGNGKSAFADIIGHAGNTQNNKFSFLSESRFNQKPEKLGENYRVKIKWINGVEEEKALYPLNNNDSIEKVKYLPQQYIEHICNDLKNGFKAEIERLIFDYVPYEEKLGKESLESLIEYLTKEIVRDIERDKLRLRDLNKKIIRMENITSDRQLKLLKSKLKDLNVQLYQEAKNEPVEVEKSEAELQQHHEINDLNSKINELREIIEIKKKDLIYLSSQQYKLQSIIDDIKLKSKKFDKWIEKINEDLLQLDIQEAIFGNININYKAISLVNERYKKDIREIKMGIATEEEDGEDGYYIKELKTLIAKRKNTMNTLTDSQLKYQRYVQQKSIYRERIEIISKQIDDIKGNIKKIKEEIPIVLEKAYYLRKSICKDIYMKKNKISQIYKEKYMYISNAINVLDINDLDKPKIEINFCLDIDSMSDKLFNNINHNIKSIFWGKDQAKQNLIGLLEHVDINSFDSLIDGLDSISNGLKKYSSYYEKLFKDREEFFNVLYGLDYIDINYNLKLGEKMLSKLSPGERGLVLLIFYLVLDKDNLPLIIDQPEDNLDNQSIFKKLVPYIIKAKERRQIIIVTHNPNIAVACDSEQIIYSKMNNEDMEIRYIYGSMESKETSQYIIDVLEGTQPAFDKRKNKYKL